MVAAAYLFTTADRAQDMAQKPVYILNHASSRGVGAQHNARRWKKWK